MNRCNNCGAPHGLAPIGVVPDFKRCAYCGLRFTADSRLPQVKGLLGLGWINSVSAIKLLDLPELGAVVRYGMYP